MAIDELDVCAEIPLHGYILFQRFGFARVNDADESGFALLAGLADDLKPVLEDFQADQGELDFGREAVMHADQGGGASAAAASGVVFVEDGDASGVAAGQMEGDGSSHDAGAEDDEVGSLGDVVRAHATASLNLPFFKSRRTW